jgi:hypothetical protein
MKRPNPSHGRSAGARSRWLAHAPLWIYPASFGTTLVFYSFAWSGLYPPLSWEIFSFLAATSGVCMLMLGVSRMTWRDTQAVGDRWWTVERSRKATLALFFALGLECLHAGGVPLLMIFSGVEYDYRAFGVPTFHVVFLGLYTFLCTHFFALFLESRAKVYLVCSLALMSISLIIVNRGALVQLVLTMALLFAASTGLRAATLLRMGSYAALFVILFGYVGDARMSSMGVAPEITILAIGDASPSYPASVVGTGPFWVYLYASSPLANWQMNVSLPTAGHFDLVTFIALELMPDFIGKHMVDEATFRTSPRLVTEALTVSSAYGRAFFLAGWWGCWAVFSLFLGYFMLARRIFRRTEYFDSAMATLGAGVALLTYFNMLSFVGLVGPLLVGAAMRFMGRRRVPRPRPSRRLPSHAQPPNP